LDKSSLGYGSSGRAGFVTALQKAVCCKFAERIFTRDEHAQIGEPDRVRLAREALLMMAVSSVAELSWWCWWLPPIESIIALLNGLATKSENEGKDEAVAYTKFEYWCKNSVKTLKKAIQEENDAIDSLSSKIDAKTKEKEALEGQIKKLEEELGKLDLSATKAQNQRKETNDLYVESRNDLQATISAVEECITALKDAGEATSFVQSKVKKVLALAQTALSQEDVQTLHSIADPDEEHRNAVKAMGDRTAHVKNDNVSELLKQLSVVEI